MNPSLPLDFVGCHYGPDLSWTIGEEVLRVRLMQVPQVLEPISSSSLSRASPR